MLERKIHDLFLRVARLEANSEESKFFDNPLKKNVREFAESQAISNDVQVAQNATQDIGPKSPLLMRSEAIVAPPTPSEIKNKPGGSEFSTLNQLVVETEEKVPIQKTKGAEPPPASLAEGKEKDLVEKANEREDVSKREKIRAIKEVMKKKSSPYMVNRMRKTKEEEREKKERNKKDNLENQSELSRSRAKGKSRSEQSGRESLSEERERKKKEREKLRQEVAAGRAKKKQERKEEEIRNLESKKKEIGNYAKMDGKGKRSLVMSVKKSLPKKESFQLSEDLRKSDPRNKVRVLQKYMNMAISIRKGK